MKIELDDKKKKMIAGGALGLLVLILIVPSFFKSDANAEEKQAPAPAVQRQAEPPRPQPPKAEPMKVEEVKQEPVQPQTNDSQAVGSVINLNNVPQPTNTISDLNVDNLIAQAGVDTITPVVVQNAASAITSDNVVKTIVVDQNGKVIEENAKNVEKTLSDPNAKVLAAINVGQNTPGVPAVAAAVPTVSTLPVMQAVAVKPASEIEVVGAQKRVVGNDVYVTASGSYNGVSSIQPIQIRDGDRTIYVDFKPEIVVSGNCCNGSCGKGVAANSSKSVNLSENKSTVISKTTKKKVKIGNKSTKKSKRGASGLLVPNGSKAKDNNIKIGKEDEYNRISCIGGCKSKLEDKRIVENKQPIVQQNNGNGKCNKAGGCSGLRQDVYVINNIVNVDEDEIITDKMLDRMENVDKPIVKNVNKAYVEDGRKVGYVSRLYANEHPSDIIRDDYNKFGEIAFVDGEYD